MAVSIRSRSYLAAAFPTSMARRARESGSPLQHLGACRNTRARTEMSKQDHGALERRERAQRSEPRARSGALGPREQACRESEDESPRSNKCLLRPASLLSGEMGKQDHGALEKTRASA